MNKKYKFLNVAAFSPSLKIGDPEYNLTAITALCDSYIEKADVFVFPELSLTGYTCADLFSQSVLLDKSEDALLRFTEMTALKKEYASKLFVLGLPIRKDNQLFNCAALILDGQILGLVPKTFIPNYNEFYEKRWFSGADARLSDTISINGCTVPFTTDLIVTDKNTGAGIAVEICEDLWMSVAPSNLHSLYGAEVILNLSASNETIAKHKYRKDLVAMQSAKCLAGYVYASSSPDESTTDIVFSGHKLIASNGSILSDVDYSEVAAVTTLDIESLKNDRRKYNSFMGSVPKKTYVYREVHIGTEAAPYLREVDAYPFVPSDLAKRKERCDEIFDIQATGLAKRMEKTGIKKLVIGISGGLDSTLALLVATKALKKLNLDTKNLIGITMPGFGTTKRTHSNSSDLMKLLGIDCREVSIVDASLQNFKDIGHDKEVYDVTYENVQARTRTLILMNTANREGALVVGTGDLSELALGWCTYNGDHMSMYAVNTGVPKTLVRYMIESVAMDYEANDTTKEISRVLYSICDTPISPELLPLDKDGNMLQKTEDSIGKYDLHDFFLFHMLRNGFSPSKIFFLAGLAFSDIPKEKILETEKTFYKRFFSQQFKRSCLPDGPKVGSVAVSPRGDLRMPSDACAALWLNELENM